MLMFSAAFDVGQRRRRISRLMTVVSRARGRQENNVVHTTTDEGKKLQSEIVTKLRGLSHDLSNYIETIMQASYLLGQARLDDTNKKWLEMVDKAAQDAARINREIREILRSQS
jgi:hypothetical protein